jgi:hypothetical protein
MRKTHSRFSIIQIDQATPAYSKENYFKKTNKIKLTDKKSYIFGKIYYRLDFSEKEKGKYFIFFCLSQSMKESNKRLLAFGARAQFHG